MLQAPIASRIYSTDSIVHLCQRMFRAIGVSDKEKYVTLSRALIAFYFALCERILASSQGDFTRSTSSVGRVVHCTSRCSRSTGTVHRVMVVALEFSSAPELLVVLVPVLLDAENKLSVCRLCLRLGTVACRSNQHYHCFRMSQWTCRCLGFLLR